MLDTHTMEKASDRRRRKLDSLCGKHGQKAVAERAGLNPQYLTQILKGTKLPPKAGGKEQAPRGLGNAACRKIEAAFGLPDGWFDNDETIGLTRNAILLAQHFGDVPEGPAKARWFAHALRQLERLAKEPEPVDQKAAVPARSSSPKRVPARR